MKTILTAIFLVLTSATAFATDDGVATILNSDLSSEDQVQIAIGVQSNCGYFKDLTQASPTISKVDYQEVGDIFLKIHLTGLKKGEQYNYEMNDIYIDAVVPAVNQNGPALAQVLNVTCITK